MPSLPCVQGLMTPLDIFNIQVDVYILPRSTMPFTKQHRQDSIFDVSLIHDGVFPQEKSKAKQEIDLLPSKSWTVEEPSASSFMPVQSLAQWDAPAWLVPGTLILLPHS